MWVRMDRLWGLKQSGKGFLEEEGLVSAQQGSLMLFWAFHFSTSLHNNQLTWSQYLQGTCYDNL